MIRVSGLCRTTIKQKVISGTVFELGAPVSREVKVYSRGTGVLLATTTSNESGHYKIYLPFEGSYTVISKDPHKKFNAVIQDNVVPK